MHLDHKKDSNTYDVLIIGGGPAGLTAAIYSSKAMLKTAFLDKGAPGGKMVVTYEIDNWPGDKRINGADLSLRMYDHAIDAGAEYIYGDVNKIIDHKYWKEIMTEGGNKYFAKAVIIASGMKEKKIGVPGEEEYFGKGVSYCAVCDGGIFKGKNIAVIGGGASAIEEATYLTGLAKNVILIHRREFFRATEQSIKILRSKENVIWKIPYVLKNISGDKFVNKITIENTETKKHEDIEVSAVFPYIGLNPETSFITQKEILDDYGFVETNVNMITKVKGIFSAGDVNSKILRQVVTAASDGAIAAVEAKNYIDGIDVQ
jgi:thioredoxin reductase (NADPH)